MFTTYLMEYEAFLDIMKAYEADHNLILVQAGCTKAAGNAFIGVSCEPSVSIAKSGWFP